MEIFELYKFGSNLSFKSDGNSVNMVNSARRISYIAGDLLLASRRGRGRFWRCAGAEEAPAWLPCASELRYKTYTVAVLRRFPYSAFPVATTQLR